MNNSLSELKLKRKLAKELTHLIVEDFDAKGIYFWWKDSRETIEERDWMWIVQQVEGKSAETKSSLSKLSWQDRARNIFKEPTIFTITSLYYETPKKGLLNTDYRGRCFGYFSHLEDAQKCVEEDCGETLSEGNYYNYVVIEETPQGISTQRKEYWYKFNPIKTIKKMWLKARKPKQIKNVICFGIG